MNICIFNSQKKLIEIVFGVLILCGTLFGQGYFGIKYAEPVLHIDAFDPFYGRKALDQVRVGELIFSRLWRWNERLNLEPDLLESMPIPDKGGLLCVLKPDLKWPDGQPITVEDVKFTIDTYRENGSSFLQEVAKYTECVKVDERQFVLKPNQQVIAFNYKTRIDFPRIQILPKHILKVPVISHKDSYVKIPVGSGPFQINGINKNGSRIEIVFKRNPKVYENPPKFEIREVRAVTEPSFVIQYEDLMTPNESSYQGDSPIIDLIIEDISERASLKILKNKSHVKRKPYARNSWIGLALNTRKPFLNSVAFRRTLDAMLDDRTLINNNYKGDAVDITGPFLRSFGSYVEDLVDRKADEKTIKEGLKDQGFRYKSNSLFWVDPKTGNKTLIKLRLIYNKNFVLSNSREKHALDDIVRKFEKFGIVIVLDPLDRVVFKEKLKDTNYWDIAYLRHTFGWNNNITPRFGSGSSNYTGYINPALLSDLEAMKSSNPVQRKEAGERIHQHCYDNVPYIFLWHVKPYVHYRNIIKDLSVTPLTFFTTIGEWWVEPR